MDQHSTPDPERFGSSDQGHFNEAYRRRPLVNAFVLMLFLATVGLAILGVIDLLSGAFRDGFKTLGAALITFIVWAAIHNWALTHPKG